MCVEIKTETWVAIVAVVIGVLISLFTIYYSNRNSRKQIITSKLEEMYQVIQILSRYYGVFVDLSHKVNQLRNEEESLTLEQYFILRDEKIPNDVRINIGELLSRIEVLAECYTNKDLKMKILKFASLLYSFFDLVTNGGSIYQELHWKDRFPDFKDFFLMVKEVKVHLIKEIKI